MNTVTECFVIAATIISILFILATYLFTYTYQVTITKKHLLHWNLIQLMRSMGLSWVLTVTSILLILISFLIDTNFKESQKLLFYNNQPYESFQLCAIISAMASGLGFTLIVFERTVASIRLKSYEKERHPKTILSLLIGIWILSVYLGNLVFVSNLNNILWLLYLSLFGMLSLGVVFCVFIYNHYWNLKKYMQAKSSRLEFSLSERFQLSENIRMSKLLFRGISCASIGGIISAACLLGCFKSDSQQYKETFYIWRTLFLFTLMATSCAYIISACVSMPFWKEMWWIAHIRRPQKINDTLSHLQTLEGNKIAFSIPIETTMHFEQLKNSWAVHTRH